MLVCRKEKVDASQYMLLQKNVNSATVKLKLLLENAELNTLNSSRKPFEFMKRTFITCKLPTEVLQMNV
jgi:hypothetical protein